MQTSPPVAALLARQRAAWFRDGPPSLEQRRADLDRLKQAVLDHRPALEQAVAADFGHRSVYETGVMEILSLVLGIRYQRRHLRRWMRPERRRVDPTFWPARAWVSHQPLGVVGIVSPWNYPVSLSLMPVATALAAGNRVMLKPSESAPATSACLARLIVSAFPPDQVTVVEGDRAVAEAFTALPFDHLVFTGSTTVGKAVMRAASEHLVPLTLELGGKSPVIIDPGQAMAPVATAVAFGKLANAGQTCVAPDYVLVQRDDAEAFAEAYALAVARLYPDGPTSDQYAAIINDDQHDRLLALVDDARALGATIRPVGVDPAAAGRRQRTLAPTLIVGATDRMRVMQEEIFGPLLPVVTYDAFDDAIAYVNARPRPLALYHFGQDSVRRERVQSRTTSGNLTLGATLVHYAVDDLPFGGVGASGMGAYHGIEGFRALSHARGVLQQGRGSLASLLRPPYGWFARLVLRLMLR